MTDKGRSRVVFATLLFVVSLGLVAAILLIHRQLQ